MSNLFWLTDDEMKRLLPFYPESHGKPCLMTAGRWGIVFFKRKRLRWRNAPVAYGSVKVLCG